MHVNHTETYLNDVIQWDVHNWGRTLKFWDKHFHVINGMKVLALGEREGGLSYHFAKKGCHVTCTDYHDFPDTTKSFHKDLGFEHVIDYCKVDIKQIPFPENSFDVVTFKSVLGALGNKEDQDRAMTEIHRVLKKDGALLFAENAVGTILHRYLRRKNVAWGNRWRYISAGDLREWKKLFSSGQTRTYGFAAVFGRSEKQRKYISKIDRVISPMTPERWRYIYFGVMIK